METKQSNTTKRGLDLEQWLIRLASLNSPFAGSAAQPVTLQVAEPLETDVRTAA
jgi:hypothetical protein